MKVFELEKEIRGYCNHPWRREIIYQDKVKWNKFLVSMDTLSDAQHAIDCYKSLDNFDSSEEGYIFIYGLMQALFLQQDACVNLVNALFGNTINFKTDYPKLYEIREYRNNSIGHPTKRGNDESFHLISRISISKNKFSLVSYFPKAGKNPQFTDISVLECIKIQEKLVSDILTKIKNKLKGDFEKHKMKFSNKKLSELLNFDFGYNVSKLYEGVWSNYPLVGMDLDIIREAYENTKKGIIERYSSLKALTGIKYSTDKLDYIFNRLENTLIKSKISDNYELVIFIDSLKNEFNEFIDMIKEIDEEFE